MSKKSIERREFLKTTALGLGMAGTLSGFDSSNPVPWEVSPKGDLHLQLAGYDYPRTLPFFDHQVKIEGCTFEIEKAGVGDMNTNTFSGPQSFDVTEIGIVPFILAYSNYQFRDYQLLPLFPFRMFRHKSVFIHADSGIKRPQDLKGKKVGTPGYSSSSLTWIRGAFQDEYGVSPKDIEWVIANKDSSADVSGKVSEQEQVQPEGVSISLGKPGMDESELLLSRDVDALFHAVEPEAFIKGDPRVIRLFKDSRRTEQEYYTKTGIFPIMHAIAVKKELLETYPWLAASVFDAYSQAKTINYNYMRKLGWAFDTLPWYGQEHESTRKLMGENFYAYGMEANRKALETICRYTFEQGLSKNQVTLEDLFFPASFEFSET